MSELAKRENIDGVKQYIDTLLKQNLQQREKQYDVGNDVLNAILCYYLSELDSNIETKVSGSLKNNIDIEAADLCVIVSNLV